MYNLLNKIIDTVMDYLHKIIDDSFDQVDTFGESILILPKKICKNNHILKQVYMNNYVLKQEYIDDYVFKQKDGLCLIKKNEFNDKIIFLNDTTKQNTVTKIII